MRYFVLRVTYIHKINILRIKGIMKMSSKEEGRDNLRVSLVEIKKINANVERQRNFR